MIMRFQLRSNCRGYWFLSFVLLCVSNYCKFSVQNAVADYHSLIKELLLYFRSVLDSLNFLGDFPVLWQMCLLVRTWTHKIENYFVFSKCSHLAHFANLTTHWVDRIIWKHHYNVFKEKFALNSFRSRIEPCTSFSVFVAMVARVAKKYISIQFANQAYNIFEVWKSG